MNQLHLTDCIGLTHANGSARKTAQFGTAFLEAVFKAASATKKGTAGPDLQLSAYAIPFGCCWFSDNKESAENKCEA